MVTTKHWGGYITTKLGRIPAQGEKVTIDNFDILIAKGNNTRIDVVKIITPASQEDQNLE